MPIEGVSFQNSGFQPLNPSEAHVQAEAASKAEAEKKIKETEKSSKTNPDSEENEDQERDLQGRDSGENDSDDENNNPDKINKLNEHNKKFKVKFNSSTEKVEMIDIKTGEIIETLAPEDLVNLLSKLKAYSGILVDKKI